MTKKNRLIASALALMVVFIVLFSACYIVAESNHNCTGDDCSICCQLTICENTLNSFKYVVVTVALAVFMGIFHGFSSAFSKETAYRSSLVTLKVKLSN